MRIILSFPASIPPLASSDNFPASSTRKDFEKRGIPPSWFSNTINFSFLSISLDFDDFLASFILVSSSLALLENWGTKIESSLFPEIYHK